MLAKWIDGKLSRMFYHFGRALAAFPAPFILIPLIATGLLGYFGLTRLELNDDLDYLFAPDDARYRRDREVLRAAGFYPNETELARMQYGQVIIEAADGNDVLFRNDIVSEVLRFDDILQKANTSTGEAFADLCYRYPAASGSMCVVSDILHLMRLAGSGPTLQNLNLTYPYYNPAEQDYTLGTYLGDELGGVELDGNRVISSRAIQLTYSLQSNASAWTDMFIQICKDFASDRVVLYYDTKTSVDDELLTLPKRVLPYLVVAVVLLTVFSVASCMMLDWVTTKPWLALTGVLCTFLSIGSSMGLVLLLGESFNTLTATIPFLLMGVGVDNMFVMIAAWRKCDYLLPVQERMGHTMADAAAAITITSITDCAAFAIGITNVFPSIRIFCVYAAVGITFAFLYQITFFAAFMALAGYREQANRHCLTCMPVLPGSEAKNNSASYRLFCAGGISKEEGMADNPSTIGFNKDPLLNVLLYRYLAPAIVKPGTKVVLAVLYVCYLAGGIWGCLNVSVGLKLQNVVADDSYVVDFFTAKEMYFSHYGTNIDIAIPEPYEYWSVEVQNAISDKLNCFDQSEYFHDTSQTAEVWLRDYLNFLNQTGNSNAATDKGEFLRILRWQFLPTVGLKYTTSIQFTYDFDGIASSRFFVIPKDMSTKEREKNAMVAAREIADREPVKMITFEPNFLLLEQILEILPSTFQTVGIAAAAMLGVAFLFIPSSIATLFVTFTLVSIDVGLVGYMALWGVQLDIASMTSILMCIGFSVDFSAHITYAYVRSEEAKPDKKLAEAMRAVGMPIVQAAFSTVLSVVVLAFFPCYLFKSFFKTMFLVMAFGAAHGLFILPALLTTMRPCRSKTAVDVAESTCSMSTLHVASAHRN